MIVGLADFKLWLSDDRMAVLMNCTITEKNIKPLITRLSSELQSMRVINLPGNIEMQKIMIDALRKGPQLRNYVLLEGKHAVLPKDAELRWALDFFGTKAQSEGTENFESAFERRNILYAKKDQLLARLNHHKEGAKGLNLLGETITVKKAVRIPLQVGSNIKVQDKGDYSLYFSGAEGRLLLRKNTLDVGDVKTINRGIVEKPPEPIKFAESLIIQGDLIGGAEVEVGGDLEVHGKLHVEKLTAGGSLFVGGSITCAPSGKITLGGGLCARRIDGALIEAGRTVVVDEEINNSTIMTKGAILAPQGKIIGGKAVALGGIVVSEAGSPGGRRTLLHTAVDFAIEEELKEREYRLEDLQDQLQEVKGTIEMLMARQRSLSPEQREKTQMFYMKEAELSALVNGLQYELDEAKAYSWSMAKESIGIKKSAHQNVTLKIGEIERYMENTLDGSITAEIKEDRIILRVSRESG